MKKILIGLLALIPFLKGSAQSAGNDTTQYIYYRFTYGNALDRYWAKKVMLIPGDTIYSKDGIALKSGTFYVGNGIKWSQVTGSGGGGGTDSADAVLYGLVKTISGTSRYYKVDSFAVESRQRGQKLADSLSVVFNGLLAGKKNITDSATNTASYATRGRAQQLIDSLSNVVNTLLSAKKDKNDSATNTSSYVTRGRLLKIIDSLTALVDVTNYISKGASGIDLFNFSTSGSQTNVTFPKIRDTSAQATAWTPDSALAIATHDSTSANALLTKYRGDTSRVAIWLAIASKVTNLGSATGIKAGAYLSRPSASNSQTFYWSTDSAFWSYDGAGPAWKDLKPGSGGGASDTAMFVTAPLKITRASGSRTIGGDSLLNKYNSDIYRLPDMRRNFYCAGISTTGTPVTNYGIGNLDSSFQYLTTTNYFPIGGSKYGALMYSSTIGTDSFTVKAPYFVWGGSSFFEGKLSRWDRLQPNGVNGFKYDYPDSVGNPAWFMDSLTNIRGYTMAVGGQGSDEFLLRLRRDVLGDSVSSTLDGRYGKTISSGHPIALFYDGVGNDPYKGLTPQQSIDNLRQMAQICQDNSIYFVVCNSPSGAGPSQAGELHLQQVNKFLESGGLEQYGAVIYDLRTFWSDPAWGANNGVHGDPTKVNSTDFTHMTIAGYRAMTIDMFQKCHIPRATKVVFQTALAPTAAPTNVAYISSFIFNGTSYSITHPIDSFVLAHPMGQNPNVVYDPGDTITVRPTAATTMVGAGTNYAIGNIYIVLDNTADGTVNTPYTRKVMGMEGATSNKPVVESIRIRALNALSPTPQLMISDNTGSFATPSLSFQTTGSGPIGLINTSTRLNNATLSIGGAASTNSLDVGGIITAEGNSISSKINLIEIGGKNQGGSYGNAMTLTTNNHLIFQSGAGASTSEDIVTFKAFSTNVPSVSTPSKAISFFGGPLGWGNAGDADSLWVWNHPLWVNQTSTVAIGYLGFRHQLRKDISTKNLYLFNDWNENGTTIFNSMKSDAGKVGIGDSIQNLRGSTILDIVDNLRGFGLPMLSTAGRDSMGSIGSISITQGTGYANPAISATGAGTGARIAATGSGASIVAKILDPGKGFKPGTSTTCTVTGTAGSGASCTLTIHGPDIGVMIYNTTVDSIQIYTAGGWQDVAYVGSGAFYQTVQANTSSQTQRAKLNFSSAFTVTDNSGNGSTDIDIASPTKFSQTADGTVTNTNTTTSIVGTGSGSQTISANTLTVGKRVLVKGFGFISTDASAPTLTITFANSSSNAGNVVTTLLSSSMNNTPVEWEYYATVRTTGSSGTAMLNGWVSIGGTKAYIGSGSPFVFNTTISQTFDVTALFGTASTNNTIVAKQCFISVN